MARFAASLAVARVLVHSRALCAASVNFRVVSTVATVATATTITAKTTARTLRGVLRDVALHQVIAGLALTISGLLLRLIVWCGLKCLIVFHVESESSLRLDPYLEAGIKSEVALAFSNCSADLRI